MELTILFLVITKYGEFMAFTGVIYRFAVEIVLISMIAIAHYSKDNDNNIFTSTTYR